MSGNPRRIDGGCTAKLDGDGKNKFVSSNVGKGISEHILLEWSCIVTTISYKNNHQLETMRLQKSQFFRSIRYKHFKLEKGPKFIFILLP